ncbi:hypothetical protein ACJMK2_024747 [Sinanodonta woodiana]|uniref:Uncharacterized protein n=1 Tax=Sinanodonta woodiana TaxID=1069815 RepID=A0ABD3XI53_SINWO
MIALKQMNPEYINHIYSINRNGCKGYLLHLKEKHPILPYGEIKVMGEKVIEKEPKPILRKIKKQTGKLHLSDIPLKIILEVTVTYFEEKMEIKVEKASLATIP